MLKAKFYEILTQPVAGHGETLAGRGYVLCATPRCARREPVSPASRRPLCTNVFWLLHRGQALALMACLAGPAGVALKGPGAFASKPLPGASCVRKVSRHGASMDDH